MIRSSALLGDVSVFPIPNVIEFLVQQGARGRLEVKSRSRSVSIVLWDAQVLPAGSENAQADLLDMLNIKRGRFCFRYFSAEEAAPASEDTAIDARFALFEALRQIDESSHLAARPGVHSVG